MKRFMIMMAAILFLTVSMPAVQSFAADDVEPERPKLYGLEKVENIVYGAPGTGGLLLRLSKVERDLFGTELPGSLSERQNALEDIFERGNSGQPSLLFKVGVTEWVTLRRVNAAKPFTERVNALEMTLENETQTGALSARLERLITKVMPNGIDAAGVSVPSNTVFTAKFVDTLTVRSVNRGDPVALEVDEDCIIDGILVAAKGDRVFSEVSKVRMPRSFGRPSEIEVGFQDVEFIDGTLGRIFIGPESQKAMKVDSATIGAAGASVVGAVLVGPVGLASGFLVRGSDKQIKEGTKVFVETVESVEVMGYQITGIESKGAAEAEPPASSGGETKEEVF